MKVKATKKGFDGTCIREAGDVFEMPDTTKVPVRDKEGKQVVKAGKPVTEDVPVSGTWFEAVVEAKAADSLV